MYSKSRRVRKQFIDYRSLEDRRLLAGNITVFENVNLYIRGDAADNQFEVVVNDGQLEIVGLEGTTINRSESYVVAGANVTDSGVTFEGGLRAHLGPGHDELELRDVQFGEMSLIFGGTGDDTIEVADSRFLERTIIQTFDGDDSISTHGSKFESEFRAMTLDGEDSVSVIDSEINGNAIVVTGNHSDSIHAQDSHFMGAVNLLLSLDGDDTVQVDNPVVGEHQLGIFLGNGDDEIRGDFMEADIAGTVRVGGQGGVDRIEMTMDEEMESSVTIGTFEATGEVVFGGLDSSFVTAFDSYSFTSDGVENPRSLGNAELFTFDEDTDVYSIAFAGSYENSVPNAFNDFVFKIFSNETGEDDLVIDIAGNTETVIYNQPDEVIHEVEFTVDEQSRVATGETYENGGSLRTTEIFNFTVDVDLQFEAGEKYWITFYQKTPEQTPENRNEFLNWFYWHAGPSETELLGASTISGGEWTRDLGPNEGNFRAMQFELRS